MIITKSALICDGCHSSIIPRGQSSVVEVSMDSVNWPATPRLYFHFCPNDVCKDRWIESHKQVLTGTIIEGLE